jgi:hypothetical protein
MDHKKYNPADKDKTPEETFNDEMNNSGSTFADTEEQSIARDAAKVEKARTGQSQKIDTVHPDELKPSRNDDIIEQERRND